ncbi:Ig-like domain-containing protein [Curtobacterium sp. NPDC098951]|uniref:Ig-like domain-containing protein n=1 Tax=Curtobacterium sp. NPDC098951 TaxID=3363974 RepID=UPI00380E64D4
MSAQHRAPARRRPARLLAGAAVTALVAGSAVLLTPQLASAAAPFPATTLYATVSGSSTVYAVDRTSGAATPAVTAPGNATGLNQIGISGDGDELFMTNSTTVFEYTASTDSWETAARPNPPLVPNQMGGVDPKSGKFFFGGLSNGSTFSFTSYDPDTNTISSNVTSVTAANPPGGNGDLAFDRQGNLYFMSSSDTAAQLYRVDAADLGGGSTTAVAVGPVITPASRLTSLAFGDDGYLYIAGSTANTFLQVNPVTGATVAQRSINQGGTALAVTDLGSRAVPSTGAASGGFTDGKAKPSDQLTISVGGGDVPKPATATTSDGNDQVTAGPIILLPGQSYTVTQSPGNTSTDPADYDTSYVCTNLTDKSVVSSGKGTEAPFTVPTSGGDVSCAFSNPLKPKVENSSSTANTPGQPATVDVLQGATGDIDPTTVQLTAPDVAGSTVRDGGKTLTVPGQGVWTVDPTSGAVTFTPEDGFTKNPTPVTYTVADTRGNQTQGQVSVTYRGAAQDDVATTDQGEAVTIDVLDNDQGGTVATSVVFPTAGQPDGATVSDDARTLSVPGVGTWTAGPTTGAVTFTPEPTFRGDASPVTYRVADADGGTSTAQIAVSVAPVRPRVADDTTTTQQNTPVTVDVAGDAASGVERGTPIDPTSVVFPTSGQPDGATVSDGGKALTVPGEGVYTVDPDSGKVTFTPAQGSTGTTAPVTYQVSDTGGQSATGTIVVRVTAVAPTAAPDSATTSQGEATTIDVLRDDTAGNAGTPLDPATVVFPATGQPAGATVSDSGKALTVPGQGVYTVHPDGTVTFTPEPTFRGPGSAVTYQVADVDGTTTSSTVAVTVTPVGPVAEDDTAATAQNTPVTVVAPGNDRPGVRGGTPIDPTLVVFPTAGQPAGAVVSADGRALTVTGEGVYTADPTTGSVLFTPVRGWAGTASTVTYRIGDTGGQTATATISVTVTPVAPTARPDTARTAADTAVTVAVLGNDGAGNARTPIVPGSVRLVDADGAPITSLAVPGKGTFTVDTTTGAVTFAPVAGFTGTLEVPYTITDRDGGTASSTITVTVGAAPVATNDTRTGTPGEPLTVDVLGNDVAGSTPIDPASVRLVDPETGELVTTVTIPEHGTFTVGEDGTVTFTPVPGFSGTVAVPYSVAGEDGSRTAATLTITYPAAPVVPGIAVNPAAGGGVVVTGPDGGRLAFTGTDVVWQGSVAALLLLAAGGTVLVLRRRRLTGR